MKVNGKKSRLLKEAIEEWQEAALLDEATANRLKKAVDAKHSPLDTVAFYAMIAAVSCALLAFGALVLDEKWIERLRRFFSFSEMIIAMIFTALSVLLCWLAKKRITKHPYARLANESFTILIALTIGIAVAYFARSMGSDIQSYGLAIFILGLLYGTAAFYLDAKLLWICALLALITAWGTQTYAWSSDERMTYFWGMNYPVRMAVFGLLLIGGTFLLRKQPAFHSFYNISWYSSWVFFLLSGLVVSVSGNLSYDVWTAIRQGKLVFWALAYTGLLSGLLIYTFRTKQDTLRDIIIVFFLLNIYTRYFEYFWDRTNKGIFFALLALSFWLIGRKAEQFRRKLEE